MTTHELLKKIVTAVGAEVLARRLGLSPGHIYRMARHPMDPDHPDGTGARNDFDRLEIIAETLATRPRARPVLLELDLWTRDLFDRVLGRHEPVELTSEVLLMKTSEILREVADVVEQARACPTEIDGDQLAKECAEAIEVLDRLYRCARESARR